VEIALRDFRPFTVVFLRVTLAALILIFTVILAHLLTSDERLTLRKILGVLIGFLGVYIMMKPELKDGFSWRGLGQIAVLGATVSYGFAGIFGKRSHFLFLLALFYWASVCLGRLSTFLNILEWGVSSWDSWS
jgi:drug/metabolite transporter (DMT)-like permease